MQLLAFLEPAYTVPSRTHFSSLLRQRHHKAKAEVTDLLAREGSPGIALTTDAWTSSATKSYATHTAHFIDQKWSLVSAVLRTSLFGGRHTGEKLAKHSHKVPKDINISKSQVVSVTHDEAANMACAAAKLSEDYNWASQVCMAHRLQTVIHMP